MSETELGFSPARSHQLGFRPREGAGSEAHHPLVGRTAGLLSAPACRALGVPVSGEGSGLQTARSAGGLQSFWLPGSRAASPRDRSALGPPRNKVTAALGLSKANAGSAPGSLVTARRVPSLSLNIPKGSFS
jgi:hypothetical protein